MRPSSKQPNAATVNNETLRCSACWDLNNLGNTPLKALSSQYSSSFANELLENALMFPLPRVAMAEMVCLVVRECATWNDGQCGTYMLELMVPRRLLHKM